MPTLRLPARMESLRQFQDFVRENGRAWGLNHLSARVELALEEVLVNVVRYAYNEETGDVQITLTRRDSSNLVVEVVDWGQPFNPLDRQSLDPRQDLRSRPIGGWGIALVRQMADKLEYTYEKSRNTLTLSFLSPQ